MKQNMQQQIEIKNTQNNLQNFKINEIGEGIQEFKPSFKKKLFNIKKTKHLRQKNSIDIFNNPIYAGLINQEFHNEDMDNYGPWTREMQLKYTHNTKGHRKKQKQQTAYNFKQRLQKYNFQNQENITEQEMLQLQNAQKNGQNNPQNDNYNNTQANLHQYGYSSPLTSMQSTVLPSLMRSKSQIKRIQQLKYTSLDLNKYVPLSKKHDLAIVKNSSPKIPKFKHSYSGSMGNLNIISRYLSRKQLLPMLQKRSSNVIYNYCCRDQFQNGNLLNIMKQKNAQSKNILKEAASPKMQQKFNKTIHKPLNHLQLYHELKRRRNSNPNQKNQRNLRLKQ